MQVIDNRVKKRFSTHDLKIGDTMIVTDAGNYSGALLLRSYDRLTNLKNPKETWNTPHMPTFNGEKVECVITVAEPIPF